MNRARLLILAMVIVFSTHPPVAGLLKSKTQKQHTDIHARYAYSGETVYRAIELDGLKLKVTYFKDADKKCKRWIEQRPCWSEKDLLTKEARLTKSELSDFVNLVNRSGFLLLENTYGGAKPGQRFYPQTIKVKLGEVQREVVYQSFPEAPTRPAAFTNVAEWLSKIVKRKLAV